MDALAPLLGVRVGAAAGRWPWLLDAGLALGLAGLAEAQLAFYDRCCGGGHLTPVGFLLTLVETLALVGRRRAPVPVLLTIGAAATAQVLLQSRVTDFAQLSVLIVFATVSARSRPSLAAVAAVLTPAGILAMRALDPTIQPSFLILVYAEFAAAWGLGQAARHHRRREAGEVAVREREAAAAERARIARELHDVVAHGLCVIAVQAGAARTVMGSAPERLDACLATIEAVSREAWVEMRELLDGSAAGGGPRRCGLAALDRLVERVESAGLPVALEVSGEPRPLAPEIDHCAYRLVQEALTNALRHTSDGPARVRVRYEEREVRMEVATDGARRAGASILAGGRAGLTGMRERVRLAGGELAIAAGPGRFVVTARLPLANASAATAGAGGRTRP